MWENFSLIGYQKYYCHMWAFWWGFRSKIYNEIEFLEDWMTADQERVRMERESDSDYFFLISSNNLDVNMCMLRVIQIMLRMCVFPLLL